MNEILAINIYQLLVMMDDGSTLEIVQLLDEDGDDTEIESDAVVGITEEDDDGHYWVFDVLEFEQITVQ